MTTLGDPFHHKVAQLALAATSQHGFALGGGQALVAHGLVRRPTEDLDLFTDVDGGVRAAFEEVRQALAGAGLVIVTDSDESELPDLFDGMDDAFEEFAVHEGGHQVRVSLARLPRAHAPVLLDVGPVMDLDDLLSSKVCALATRAQVRDYVDVAAALGHGYQREQLLALAEQIDPGLSAQDFARAMVRLDALPDGVFGHYGLDGAAVAAMRARVADWPRSSVTSG